MSRDAGRPMARRIVTGNDAAGRSFIVSDEEVPDGELWRTWGEAPMGLAAAVLLPSTSPDLEPPQGGSRVSRIALPPWATMKDEVAAGGFHGLDPDGFHRTRTIDYVAIVEGELELALDTGRTTVRAGDIVIQRNTSHAWYNHGDRDVIFWGMMVRVD